MSAMVKAAWYKYSQAEEDVREKYSVRNRAIPAAKLYDFLRAQLTKRHPIKLRADQVGISF